MDSNGETIFKITTITLVVLLSIMGVILTLSFVAVCKIHKQVMILKARHVQINTKSNESYAVFKGMVSFVCSHLFPY